MWTDEIYVDGDRHVTRQNTAGKKEQRAMDERRYNTMSWETTSSSRPSLSRSPLRRGDSDTRQSLTNVPFVLPRSSTVSSVWVA